MKKLLINKNSNYSNFKKHSDNKLYNFPANNTVIIPSK